MRNNDGSSRDAIKSAPWYEEDEMVHIEDSLRIGDFEMSNTERFILSTSTRDLECASCHQIVQKGTRTIYDKLQGLECHQQCPPMKGVAPQDNVERIFGHRNRQQLRDYPPVECPQSEREPWGL